MAVTITRPAGRRLDDLRALKLRYRVIAPSGSYVNGTGEVISAQSVGLKRIYGVIQLNNTYPAVSPAIPTPGYLYSINVASDGRSFTFKQVGDAAGASGSAFGVERSSAAYNGDNLVCIIVGEG